MKKQKANSHEDITWSEMGKQNIQAKEVYSSICIRYEAIDKQGHQSVTARIKMFNTDEMFKEKSKINPYQIAYRYLVVVALSLGNKLPFFSKSCEMFQFILCALHSLRVSHPSAVRTACFHRPLSLPLLNPGRLVCFPEYVALV